MIGYNLTHYNPCINYNKDNFCGTADYKRMMNNVQARKVASTHSTTYNAERNGPFPGPYVFTPVGEWQFPCDRDAMYSGKPCNK